MTKKCFVTVGSKKLAEISAKVADSQPLHLRVYTAAHGKFGTADVGIICLRLKPNARNVKMQWPPESRCLTLVWPVIWHSVCLVCGCWLAPFELPTSASCTHAFTDAMAVFKSAGGIIGVLYQLPYCASFLCAPAMDHCMFQRSTHVECESANQSLRKRVWLSAKGLEEVRQPINDEKD